MKEKVLLKDTLFNTQKVEQLAGEIKAVYPAFDQDLFTSDVLAAFPELELKARIGHMAEVLYTYLPSSYRKAIEIIEKALPEPLDNKQTDNDFGDFIYAPYASYVAKYGCTEVYLQESLQLLRTLTKRFSVEFAIRDFINAFPEETIEMLRSCALSEYYHERRLASEGLRPKLPWAKKLTIAYPIALEILELLYADRTRYVTRSVANHLNDISKIDPGLVIRTLKRWSASGKQDKKEMDFIVSHALRTLVKSGEREALALLGYRQEPKIRLSSCEIVHDAVRVGECLEFACILEAEERCKLLIDYVIYFQTKKGDTTPKVHKMKKVVLEKGNTLHLRKRHLFKADMSTRKFYSGEHKVVLQINGKPYTLGSCMLKV